MGGDLRADRHHETTPATSRLATGTALLAKDLDVSGDVALVDGPGRRRGHGWVQGAVDLEPGRMGDERDLEAVQELVDAVDSSRIGGTPIFAHL